MMKGMIARLLLMCCLVNAAHAQPGFSKNVGDGATEHVVVGYQTTVPMSDARVKQYAQRLVKDMTAILQKEGKKHLSKGLRGEHFEYVLDTVPALLPNATKEAIAVKALLTDEAVISVDCDSSISYNCRAEKKDIILTADFSKRVFVKRVTVNNPARKGNARGRLGEKEITGCTLRWQMMKGSSLQSVRFKTREFDPGDFHLTEDILISGGSTGQVKITGKNLLITRRNVY